MVQDQFGELVEHISFSNACQTTWITSVSYHQFKRISAVQVNSTGSREAEI